MSNNISDFKTNFKGGTRANRFKVWATWPAGVVGYNTDMEFNVSATSMPVAQIGTVLVPYRGRPAIYAGDRQYSPWTITVYDDDQSNHLWEAFHKWGELIDGHLTHEKNNTTYSYSDLQSLFKLYQYDTNGNTIRQISLWNSWPLAVTQIDLNMGSVDLVQFQVQLVFDKIDIVQY